MFNTKLKRRVAELKRTIEKRTKGLVLLNPPCPLCGEHLRHIESWARSFSPNRLYHEYHHPEADCWLSNKVWPFEDDEHSNRRKAFLSDWVRRFNYVMGTKP